MEQAPNELCDNGDGCGHSKDDHVVAAIGPIPLGGVMFCPVDDCDCYSSWAVQPESARIALADQYPDLSEESRKKALAFDWQGCDRAVISMLAGMLKQERSA